MPDLFLYNGFTPRRRSPGDLFLDNGIALLRAHLGREGIDVVVEDRITLDGYEEFRRPDLTRPLRDLFARLVFPEGPAPAAEQAGDRQELLRRYGELLRFQDLRMEAYLARLAERIARERTPVVGMKIWFGSTFLACKRLCEMIRRASPETIVVVGGPHANCFYPDGLILKHSPFDLAVYSEGEAVLARIVRIARRYRTRRERLEAIAGANVPNAVCRTRDGVRVNPAVPIPINEKLVPEYTAAELGGKLRNHTLIDGLGCDYAHCTFCIHPTIYPKFRLRDPRLVVDEIEHMVGRGIGFFTFTASDTPLPHARRISEEILRRGLRLEFTMLARGTKGAAGRRAYLVEAYRTIIRAGMRILFIGAESGNDLVLREVLHKNLTAEDIVHTVACIREASAREGAHVFIITSYIFPLPLTDRLLALGITMGRVFRDNVELARATRPDSFQVIPAIVYAGTDWYAEPERYNLAFDRERFAAESLELEISVHALVDPALRSPYGFNGRPIADWLPLHRELSSTISALGIPAELNDEHILIARAAGYDRAEDLVRLSRELFLDTVSCDDEVTRPLMARVNAVSREIAASNAHLPAGAR